jgi:hypothetical protein
MSEPESQAQQTELYNAFKSLYDSLNDAYWAASTIETKDCVAGARDQVYDVMMDLIGQDLKSRTAAFQALSQKVSDIDASLEALGNDIGALVARISAVNQVIADITQVVSLTKTFFI